MDEIGFATLVATTLRVATPLILCALAATLSERAGVIDLGLEGKMLATAFAAGAAASASGSLPVAFAAALAVGVALSMVHGLACVTFRGDQVVAGMAITMTCAGLTVALGVAWFHLGGQTPALPDELRLSRWFGGPGGETPMLGLLGHNGLVYAALVLVPVVAWLLDHTRFGLRLQATGENPAMVDAAGVSVAGLRYSALALNGMLCALAGAYLVLAQSPQFVPNMTAGRGYMAMAAMIFGHWRPLGAFGACLLFGFLDALAIRLQGTPLPGLGAVPVQAIQALPYALTVILLAGFIGRARAPRALGQPYVKER
ncbi:ABC transporter permease [Ideonella sp. YS5]|uniref:ABC transporter permease n=1 Tax=Ideonella sp. YS5 TaxID=3453714 RepID=UPI003EEC65E7